MRPSVTKSRFRLPVFLFAAAVVAALGSMQSARAVPVTFSDDFNSYTGALDVTGTFGGWHVSQGSIDLIPIGNQFHFYPDSNGTYVDLNGTSGQLGGISTVQSFAAGNYTLTFNLGGSVGGDNNVDPNTKKQTIVSLGDWSTTIGLMPNDGWTSQTFSFTTTGGTLNFASLPSGEGENRNVGNILNNVVLVDPAPTPLPSTWSMLISGFFGIGFMVYLGTRKRRRDGAASLVAA